MNPAEICTTRRLPTLVMPINPMVSLSTLASKHPVNLFLKWEGLILVFKSLTIFFYFIHFESFGEPNSTLNSRRNCRPCCSSKHAIQQYSYALQEGWLTWVTNHKLRMTVFRPDHLVIYYIVHDLSIGRVRNIHHLMLLSWWQRDGFTKIVHVQFSNFKVGELS